METEEKDGISRRDFLMSVGLAGGAAVPDPHRYSVVPLRWRAGVGNLKENLLLQASLRPCVPSRTSFEI